jgi:type I restriction enzyme S subunit
VSDLYELPKGWKWEKLDNLTEVNIGKTPKRSNKEFFLGDKVWLSIRDLKGDYVSDSNEAIASLPIKDESVLDKYFLKYSIGVIDLEKEVDNAVKGKTLNKQKIKNLDIPLPPLSEQQRIVSKLDNLFEKIDKAIALHVKNMEEADGFMASVLNDVFGELEEKYGLIEVGDVTDCIVPQRNKPKQFVGDIQWITTDDLQLFKRISKSTKGLGLRREDIEEVKSKTFPKESVLMSCVGDLGIVAIADDEIVVNQQLHTYQCKDNLLNTFLMYALYVKRDYMYQIANITTVAYMNKSKCNSIPIPLPSLQIQQKVVKYLDEISETIEKVKSVQKQKMDSLKALKASILDKAFRGEL